MLLAVAMVEIMVVLAVAVMTMAIASATRDAFVSLLPEVALQIACAASIRASPSASHALCFIFDIHAERVWSSGYDVSLPR